MSSYLSVGDALEQCSGYPRGEGNGEGAWPISSRHPAVLVWKR